MRRTETGSLHHRPTITAILRIIFSDVNQLLNILQCVLWASEVFDLSIFGRASLPAIPPPQPLKHLLPHRLPKQRRKDKHKDEMQVAFNPGPLDMCEPCYSRDILQKLHTGAPAPSREPAWLRFTGRSASWSAWLPSPSLWIHAFVVSCMFILYPCRRS